MCVCEWVRVHTVGLSWVLQIEDWCVLGRKKDYGSARGDEKMRGKKHDNYIFALSCLPKWASPNPRCCVFVIQGSVFFLCQYYVILMYIVIFDVAMFVRNPRKIRYHLWVMEVQIQHIRNWDIIFLIPHALLSFQNMLPTLPTMQLGGNAYNYMSTGDTKRLLLLFPRMQWYSSRPVNTL